MRRQKSTKRMSTTISSFVALDISPGFSRATKSSMGNHMRVSAPNTDLYA
jgi:hypothetical protein